MIDDIVTRLLALNHPDAADAADEIERLRALIKALHADRQTSAWQEARRG
jgi:hypothetical protein